MDYIALVLLLLFGLAVAWIVINALNNHKHPPSK